MYTIIKNIRSSKSSLFIHKHTNLEHALFLINISLKSVSDYYLKEITKDHQTTD